MVSYQIYKGVFSTLQNTAQEASFLNSNEDVKLLKLTFRSGFTTLYIFVVYSQNRTFHTIIYHKVVSPTSYFKIHIKWSFLQKWLTAIKSLVRR